jgi:hypothetical protein
MSKMTASQSFRFMIVLSITTLFKHSNAMSLDNKMSVLKYPSESVTKMYSLSQIFHIRGGDDSFDDDMQSSSKESEFKLGKVGYY